MLNYTIPVKNILPLAVIASPNKTENNQQKLPDTLGKKQLSMTADEERKSGTKEPQLLSKSHEAIW